MKQKRWFLFGALALLVLVVSGLRLWWWPQWWAQKSAKIGVGLANERFPWRDYSQAELDALNPEKQIAAVKTTVAPEQTYAKFRAALRANDLEGALAQLATETPRYLENKAALEKAHREGQFAAAYEWYPAEIERSSMYESIATFQYYKEDGQYRRVMHISFQKNKNGVWLIESL